MPKKIILVEDDEIGRFALAKYLRREGFEVVEAVNGKDAVIEREIDDADIMVTDILMPDRDGIELLADLRLKSSNLPVIAISGGGRISSDEYLETAEALGAAKVFKKPFDEAALADAIRAITAA